MVQRCRWTSIKIQGQTRVDKNSSSTKSKKCPSGVSGFAQWLSLLLKGLLDPLGGNHLGNLVLACGRCNGDEKRDEHWLDFLRQKAPDATALKERQDRIVAWFALNPRTTRAHSPEVEHLQSRCEALVEEFGAACNELKAALRREKERLPNT